MGILDPAKLAVVFVVALVVLGPDKLPNAARQVGSMWRTFAHYRELVENETRGIVDGLGLHDLPGVVTHPRQAVSSFLGDLTTVPPPSSTGGVKPGIGNQAGVPGQAATAIADAKSDVPGAALVDPDTPASLAYDIGMN